MIRIEVYEDMVEASDTLLVAIDQDNKHKYRSTNCFMRLFS
jgi:hypothetical protein